MRPGPCLSPVGSRTLAPPLNTRHLTISLLQQVPTYPQAPASTQDSNAHASAECACLSVLPCRWGPHKTARSGTDRAANRTGSFRGISGFSDVETECPQLLA